MKTSLDVASKDFQKLFDFKIFDKIEFINVYLWLKAGTDYLKNSAKILFTKRIEMEIYFGKVNSLDLGCMTTAYKNTHFLNKQKLQKNYYLYHLK